MTTTKQTASRNPNVVEIVAAYLAKHGFDGLYYPDVCSCQVSDLAPCGEMAEACCAGYRVEGCTPECGQGCDWHICESKTGDR